MLSAMILSQRPWQVIAVILLVLFCVGLRGGGGKNGHV